MKISSSKLSLFCGAISIALGAMVVFAWATNNMSLIQIRPTLVPMPISTALGFVLSGLGLILLNLFYLRAAQIVGGLTFVFGGLTLLGVLLPSNLFGDFSPSLETAFSHPMSPNTSLCFTFAGLAFLAVTHHPLTTKGTLISGVLGALIFALGSLAFFAHLIDLSATHGWGRFMRMAIHTPGGFGILAIGLISFAWQNEPSKVIGSPQWLPVLIGVGVMTITFGLWIHIDIQEPSVIPTAVLMFGLLMSALLSLAVYFMQRERRLLEHLHLSHQGLEKEIHERKQVEEHLRGSQEELRNLSHRLQSIREEEKCKIAREVHDELGQSLTALKMDLSCLEEDASRNPNAFREKIHSMADLLDQTVGTVQRICLELRPKILEVFGLSEAIEWQMKEFHHRTGIQCELVMDQGHDRLDTERSITCFRVLQEALTNVARHARATHVHVRVGTDNGFLLLEVNDNGGGIEADKIFHSHSLGLIGIRERVLPLGGTVSIRGNPGEGTQVSITIPYPQS